MKGRNLFAGSGAWMVGCVLALAVPASAGSPSLSPSGLLVRDIKDTPRLADIANRLQTDMLRLGLSGRITACDHAVHLASDNGDDSFGALCSVEHASGRRAMLMCDDQLVGKFALAVTFMPSIEQVTRFTDVNCTGG